LAGLAGLLGIGGPTCSWSWPPSSLSSIRSGW
jgi:hypothetical protein